LFGVAAGKILGGVDQFLDQRSNVGVRKVDGFARVRPQTVVFDPAMANFPFTVNLHQIVLIGTLSHDPVAAGRGDRGNASRTSGRVVAVHLIQKVERQLPPSQRPHVRLGLLSQRLVTAHDAAIEFERAIGHEASRPPV
jgi:hypothetical protein